MADDELDEVLASPAYASAVAKLAHLRRGEPDSELLTHDEGQAIETVRDLTGNTGPDWPAPKDT